MSNSSDWYDEIAGEISKFLDKLEFDVYLKLDYFLNMAKLVDSFSADCDKCEKLRGSLTQVVRNQGGPNPTTDLRWEWLGAFHDINLHHMKDHSWVPE